MIDVRWEAIDALAPLVNVFSQDQDIINFVKDVGDIEVHTHPKQFQGWTVELRTYHNAFMPVVMDHWNVLHKIPVYIIPSPRDCFTDIDATQMRAIVRQGTRRWRVQDE